jgi:hypothetical protein
MERDPNLSKGFVPTELWRFVRQIRFPTLYALGADNRIVAPETQQKLRSVLPHVQIVVLPGRGHYSDQERLRVYSDCAGFRGREVNPIPACIHVFPESKNLKIEASMAQCAGTYELASMS